MKAQLLLLLFFVLCTRVYVCDLQNPQHFPQIKKIVSLSTPNRTGNKILNANDFHQRRHHQHHYTSLYAGCRVFFFFGFSCCCHLNTAKNNVATLIYGKYEKPET